ncbi:phage tail tape measure protein, partial [Escherichia coli]|nr:phage tail tape measure protein [Escherichia coli]
MSQIADLVIDLSVDAADFKEQLPRIKAQLNGTASEAARAEARVRQFEASQKQAATTAVKQAQALAGNAQKHVSLAENVEETRQRLDALNRKMREEQAQAAA